MAKQSQTQKAVKETRRKENRRMTAAEASKAESRGNKNFQDTVSKAAAKRKGNQTKPPAAQKPVKAPNGPTQPPATKRKSGNTPFGTAFKAARKAGKKTFTFGGKSYTTKIKGEK